MMKERPILFSTSMVQAILQGRKTQTRRIIKWPGKNFPADIKKNPTGDKWYKDYVWSMRVYNGCWGDYKHERFLEFCKQGKTGDRLWVRETWYCDDVRLPEKGKLPKIKPDWLSFDDLYYRADGECCEQIPECECHEYDGGTKWRPSIFMPRWASRILLEITDVKVERIQDISEEDAKAEGLAKITKDGSLYKYGIPDSDGLPGNDDYGWHWQDWNKDPRIAFFHLWDLINKESGFGVEVNPWVWAIHFKVLEVRQ